MESLKKKQPSSLWRLKIWHCYFKILEGIFLTSRMIFLLANDFRLIIFMCLSYTSVVKRHLLKKCINLKKINDFCSVYLKRQNKTKLCVPIIHFQRYVRPLFHFLFILCCKTNYSCTFPWPYRRCKMLCEMSNRKNYKRRKTKGRFNQNSCCFLNSFIE